jgi:hypothetical protein
MRQQRQLERCFSATSHGMIALSQYCGAEKPSKLLQLPRLSTWLACRQPHLDHGTSSGISRCCELRRTPPAHRQATCLIVSAETFWTLVCSFGNSTNSGRVAARSLPEAPKSHFPGVPHGTAAHGLICATGKFPVEFGETIAVYLNSHSMLAGRTPDLFHPSKAALSLALPNTTAALDRRPPEYLPHHLCLAGQPPRSLSHRWRRLR